jgi:hypothetical protein
MAQAPLLFVVGTLLSLGGFTQLFAAVEVRTTSGDVIMGEIAEENAKTLQIKRLVMIKHQAVETTISINKDTITTRKEVPTLLEQYNARAEKTPNILLPQCSLARWCYERALVPESLRHTQIAEKLDTNNPIVASLYTDLGYLRENETWISQEEYLAKNKDKVSVGGTIMTKEEAEAVKANILLNGSTARLEQQIRDAEWTIKSSETKIAEYTAQRDEAKADEAKAKADAAGAKNRMESLAKRMDERSDRQQTNRTQNKARDDQAALSEATATYNKANSTQKKSERAKEAAEERLEKYKVSLEKAKKELPELKKQLEALTGKPSEEPTAGADKNNKPEAKANEEKKEANAKSRFGDLK